MLSQKTIEAAVEQLRKNATENGIKLYVSYDPPEAPKPPRPKNKRR
jgi:hypothetical protein